MKRAERCRTSCLVILFAGVGLLVPGLGHAETVDITLPAAISFNVFNVNSTTTGSPNPASVSFTNTSLDSGRHLKISVAADTANFSTPGSGTAIPANKISWTTSSPVGGSGSDGTLSDTAYTTLFTSNADPSSGSVNVQWSLATLPAGVAAGNHTLTLRWKLESLL